jgi:hypothetical protein
MIESQIQHVLSCLRLIARDKADGIEVSEDAQRRYNDALQRRLRRARYHIFHFIGHGEFDQTMQEGVLLLEREQQRGHRVGSQYLGMLLHDHESLRVAVLNACEGARTSKQDPFAGAAQTLVQQGIPAVIAMQFEIADDVAGTFAHEFYGALSDGYPIDAAVTEARKAIFAMGCEVEWATPVLYLRAPDGRIFDIDRTAAARPPAPAETSEPPRVAATPAATTVAQPLTVVPRSEPATAAPQDRAAALLRSADMSLAMGDFETALEHLEEVRPLEPDSELLAELTVKAQEQRAVAETRAHLRAEFREHLDAANALLTKRDLPAALARIADALRLRPGDPEAIAVHARISRQMDDARAAAARTTPAVTVRTEEPRQEGPPPSAAAPPAARAVRDTPEAKPRQGKTARPAPRDPADDESDLREF